MGSHSKTTTQDQSKTCRNFSFFWFLFLLLLCWGSTSSSGGSASGWSGTSTESTELLASLSDEFMEGLSLQGFAKSGDLVVISSCTGILEDFGYFFGSWFSLSSKDKQGVSGDMFHFDFFN